ncbi:MAG: polysaccharide biosynthesis protein [Armatimonadota bacterium]|nr:MAG: polysaccharide biosynthesis protein [Armatimonadota bacterium]
MLRSLVKDSAVYAVGTIASRLVGFIMIPVYTRVLTPADYGIIETIVRLVDIIGLFLALGLAEALLRHYYLAKDEEERRRLIGTVFNINLMVVILGSLFTLPASPYLARLAFGHERYTHYVIISLISMLVGNLIELPLTLWRAEGKAWRFTAVSLSKLFSQLMLNIVLVVWLRWGVWGVVLSGLINASVWSLVLGVLVRLRYGGAFDMRWVKPVLRYGLPLVPASLSQFILHFSDRFFLTRYATESELGLYSLAYRFGMLVSVFFGVLSRAWWPWVFRVAEEEEGTRHLRRGGALILLSGAAFCSAVILLSSPVIRVIASPTFWDASYYVTPIAIAYWFFISSSSLRIGALIAHRTSLFAIANVVSAVLCLVLNAWLIPNYSAWGAAYATATSFAVFAILVWFASQRVNPLPHDYGAIVLSFVVILVASWLDRHLRFALWIDLFARVWIWMGLGVVLLLFFAWNHKVRLPVLSTWCKREWTRGS